MSPWKKWEFSSEGEDRLKKICCKLNNANASRMSSEWLDLLNYSSLCPNNYQMEVDDGLADPKEEEIINLINEGINNDTEISETIFEGISMNSLNRILISTSEILNEFRFCTFCKLVASWNNFTLIEHSMKIVVLSKLKQIKEASGCVIFSIKELAVSKPDQFCQNVLIPLLSDCNYQFTDVDLLSAVFPVLPTSQKNLVILTFTKKTEFFENDWLLLQPLIKDMSQNNLLKLFDCIQEFSHKFTKSQIFGRTLLNFCKNFNFIGNKDVLLEVINKHQTLLKIQALKFLESV